MPIGTNYQITADIHATPVGERSAHVTRQRMRNATESV
jgi:hypothetical protein